MQPVIILLRTMLQLISIRFYLLNSSAFSFSPGIRGICVEWIRRIKAKIRNVINILQWAISSRMHLSGIKSAEEMRKEKHMNENK